MRADLANLTVSTNTTKVLVDRDIPIEFNGEKSRTRIIRNVDVAGDSVRNKLTELETTKKTGSFGQHLIPPSTSLSRNTPDSFPAYIRSMCSLDTGPISNTPESCVPSSVSSPPDDHRVALINKKVVNEKTHVMSSPDMSASEAANDSNRKDAEVSHVSLPKLFQFPSRYLSGRNMNCIMRRDVRKATFTRLLAEDFLEGTSSSD